MIPQALLDHAVKSSGLICVAGDRNSHIDQTLVSLTKFLGQSDRGESKEAGRQKGALILRQAPNSLQVESPFLIIQYGQLSEPLVQKNLSECHFFIFEKLMKFDELEWALQLAEEGRMVIVHAATSSICSLLHRFFSLWPDSEKEHWHWRFSDKLQLLFSQVVIPRGLESESSKVSELSMAYEMALATPLVKKHLRAGDLNVFEADLRKTEDKSGFLSLNQSLLQLLIRRKIDITAAFETTRDPEDLDMLLKKVGI